jgi:hypothetical protein
MVMMILHLLFNRFMAPACFHLHLLKAEEAAENIEQKEEENLLKLSPPPANCGTTSPSTALLPSSNSRGLSRRFRNQLPEVDGNPIDLVPGSWIHDDRTSSS